MPTLQKHSLTCTNTTVRKLVVMSIFPKSHGLHREIYSASKSIILFAVLLMNMSGTLAQTCNGNLVTYTLPSAGSKITSYNDVLVCPVFTAPVDGFLDYMTILSTGDLNGGPTVIDGGAQFRSNTLYLASPSQPDVCLTKDYITRTRAIQLHFLQGEYMSGTRISVFVSFTYAYVQVCISCR